MKQKIPMSEVMTWLNTTQPALHSDAHVDRDWVWITTDLRGDDNKERREAIKEFGFRFAMRGHDLPNGKTAFWGHSCNRPTRFKRHGKGAKPNDTTTHNQIKQEETINLEALV